MSNEETPPEVPASLIGADGALTEGWQKQAPEGFEDLREDKSLETVNNLWNLSKSFVHVRKQVPVDKMPRPNENFTDSDWNEYYSAGGRPDTKEDYNIKSSEEIPEEFRLAQDVADRFQEVFHKYGASKKLAEALTSLNDEITLNEISKSSKVHEQRHNAMMDALHKEFGQATSQRTNWSNSAINRGVKGNDELRAFIAEKMNNENDIVPWSIFLSNIESNFAEHGEFADSHIDTPSDINEQIKEIQESADFKSTDKPTRMKAVEKIMALRNKLPEGAVI